MSKTLLDPNLASILDSIRATVGGETAPPTGRDLQAMLDAEAEEPATAAMMPEAGQHASARAIPAAPAAKPAARKSIPPATRTVEDFLAELIRPQVEAWLAAHLPEIIQKQAAEEIARLTGKA